MLELGLFLCVWGAVCGFIFFAWMDLIQWCAETKAMLAMAVFGLGVGIPILALGLSQLGA